MNQAAHYQNRTNNRVESFNQKLKAVICSYAPLKHFFRDLSMLVSSMGMEKTTKAIWNNQKVPSRLLRESCLSYQYRKHLTTFAFERMKNHIDDMVNYEFTQVEQQSAHTSRNAAYVYTTEIRCNCDFFQVMRLPCKHIMKFRQLKDKSAFAPELCDERWHRTTASRVLEKTASIQFVKGDAAIDPNRQLTRSDKVGKAFDVFEKIITNIVNVEQFDDILDEYSKSCDIIANLPITGETFNLNNISYLLEVFTVLLRLQRHHNTGSQTTLLPNRGNRATASTQASSSVHGANIGDDAHTTLQTDTRATNTLPQQFVQTNQIPQVSTSSTQMSIGPVQSKLSSRADSGKPEKIP